MLDNMGEFWVFGYGSLLWNPGFEPVETRFAKLHGRHRKLCVYSWVHRGTQEEPGLVFGLDRGGSCHGKALRVAEDDAPGVLQYLRERELVTHVYREVVRPVQLEDGRVVNSLVYVVDRKHKQYAGGLGHDDLMRLVRQGHGKSGPNTEYVINTVDHLASLGIRDRALEHLADEIRKGSQ